MNAPKIQYCQTSPEEVDLAMPPSGKKVPLTYQWGLAGNSFDHLAKLA